jgi:hypothetical protein
MAQAESVGTDSVAQARSTLEGAGEDVDVHRPVCATCGEAITGEGVTVIYGGAHHEGCAPLGQPNAVTG